MPRHAAWAMVSSRSEAHAAALSEAAAASAAAASAAESELRLVSGACVLPHPDKAARGGEDAFFIEEDASAVGERGKEREVGLVGERGLSSWMVWW